ncbi:GNAT family N-acetyltransferase [Pseudomonas sp. GCM10022186]|uniref:GNAT family N-acetyltransferase n=1 Tax=Pseudomonas sp. GCM10022186 TaxID=3252650 RepID=UPI00360EA1AD
MSIESVEEDVVIRLPQVGDARAIAEVHVRSWQAAYQGLLSAAYLQRLEQGIERRVAYLEGAIGNGARSIRVAEAGGRLLGWSSFGASRDADVPPGTGELMSLYLAPEAWARGLGSALWRASRQELEDAGFRAVTAWVLDGNARAIRFYRKLGLRADAASQRVFEEDGEPLPLTRFHLSLAASA